MLFSAEFFYMDSTESIEVMVEPDFSDYRRILRERGKVNIKNNQLGIAVEVAAILIWLVAMFFVPDFDGFIHRTALVVLAVLLVLHIFVYIAFISDINAQAKKAAGAGPIRYLIGPDGIRSSSKMVTWESPWLRFSKVVEVESGLLFISNSDDLVAIPKRFLQGPLLTRTRKIVTENATGRIELFNSK